MTSAPPHDICYHYWCFLQLDELTSAFGGVRGQRAIESRLKNKIQSESLDAAMSNVVADVFSRPDADLIIGNCYTSLDNSSGLTLAD